MSITLLVGTYAAKGGVGLVPVRLGADHRWSVGEPIPHVRNASFGCVYGDRALFVDEVDGTIGLLGAGDEYRLLVTAASGGAAPCHAAVDASAEWAAVANYGSGSVALFRVEDERLRGPTAVHCSSGSGPKLDRQDGPHAHWVGFSADARHLLFVDLGSDRIIRLAIDKRREAFGEPITLYSAPAGSGPRHLVFHPRLPRAYLVSELAATVTVLDTADSVLRSRTVLALPGDGDTLGGAIAIDGTGERLYVTSRGHDSIATYALDAAGEPSLLDVVPSGGASPRHLCLLRGQLLVANEDGGTVCAFRLDDAGLPVDSCALEVPGAAFIILEPR